MPNMAVSKTNVPLTILYSGNALWYSSAFYYFCFKQRGIMQKYSKRKLSPDAVIRSTASGDAWHHDLAAYLGGMNTALASLAFIRLYAILSKSKMFSTDSPEGEETLDRTALLVLGIGNLSQAYLNFRTGFLTDRWIMGKGFDIITVLDALFATLDLVAFYRKLK